MVAVPASLSPDGRFSRRYYKSEKAAEAHAQKLRSEYHKGHRGTALDVVEARDAARALTILKKHGVTLTAAAKFYAEKMAGDRSAESFGERLARHIDQNEAHWSARYYKDFRLLEKRLPKWLLRMKVGAIDADEIDKAAREGVKGTTAIAIRKRMIRSAIACKAKAPPKRKPKIFTKKQVDALLNACETDQERRAVGLMLFAGVRPDAENGEITKLRWEDVNGHHIHIRAEASKTGTDRLIPLRLRLRRLLKGRPKTGKVVPPNWKRLIQRIRRTAGIDGTEYQDAARHTFASHHLVAYGESKTKDAMGHAAGSRTLFQHYRQAVTANQGKEYFK